MALNNKNRRFNLGFLLRGKPSPIILVTSAITILLMAFIFSGYSRHKEIIVQQQEEHLMSIAQTVAKNLESFISDKAQITDMYFDEISSQADNSKDSIGGKFISSIEKFYSAQNSYIGSAYLLNKELETLYKLGVDDDIPIKSYIQSNRDLFLNKAAGIKQATIGPVFMGNGMYFLLGIIEPLFIDNKLQGFVLCTINLDNIYERFVAPIKVGERGYILVKNNDRRIIMYKAKEQVGIDVIEGRREKYPDLYYKDLENLIERQMSGETGTALYYSYWWNGKDVQKVKKIAAFTPMKVGEGFWVISVQMDYNEVELPVKSNLNTMLFLGIIILVILSYALFRIMGLTRNKEALEIETRYLRELNTTYAELQRSEQKARNYQRLQTIGTLTGGIAHEFNNLLTPILGYCEMLQKEVPVGSELEENINEIYKIAQKTTELVKQILAFGRHGKNMSVFKPLNISPFIKDTVKMIKNVLPRSVTFIEKINPDCGYVYANTSMINEIVLNLCTNAYQAMMGSKGTITVELDKVAGEEIRKHTGKPLSNEIYVMLKVTDTGCGMDEETISKIFDPFFTTKDKDEGTGLGLWVVQSMVLELKGEIVVESEKGKGSTFHVYFPWLGQDIEEENPDTGLVKRRDNIRILLVEDEADIVKVFKRGLTKLGYIVESETDPADAIARFKAHPDKYNVVITDYIMPKITGLELAGIIKNIREDVKVILVTGFIEKSPDEIIENRYIDDYLFKPVSSSDLDAKIQGLFKNIQ